MRLLFQLDTRDYDPNGKAFVRPSVRGIIIRAGKVGMVHSQKYDYYKFPGGGVEAGESRHQADKASVRTAGQRDGLIILPPVLHPSPCICKAAVCFFVLCMTCFGRKRFQPNCKIIHHTPLFCNSSPYFFRFFIIDAKDFLVFCPFFTRLCLHADYGRPPGVVSL